MLTNILFLSIENLFLLSFNCLTAVEKLFHIRQKALAHIWKSFSTSVKNIKGYEDLTIWP